MIYGEDIIEEVRSRNDIVDLISSYVSLKKKGSSYFGLCPFHNEKSPSFSVSRDKQMYYCFGCGAGGNIYTFLMEYENFSFPEAVRFLADRAGMELPEEELDDEAKKQMDEKARLREMNKLAANYFYYLLHQKRGEKGLEYLKKRGITEETIRRFGLGYADIYNDDLYRFLKSKGYSDEELKDSALVNIDEQRGGSDKFWNRVMFPIVDVNNRVIGFGGRVMGDGTPKYLNSKETKLFDKSRNLYGLNFARSSRKNEIILCEGYMDVISMHQAGFTNAVAALGTAFTSGHGTLLRRYTENVILSFDSDEAGQRAILRAIPILKDAGLTVKVLDLTPYKDPDEFIKELGAEALEERIRKAVSSFMFQVKVLSKKYNQDDPEEKTKFQHEAAKLLAVIEEPLERKNYIDAVSREYYMAQKEFSDLVNYYGTSGYVQRQEVQKKENEEKSIRREDIRESKKKQPQKLLLTWLVNEPILFEKLRGLIGPDDFYDPIYHGAALMLFSQYEEERKVIPAKIMNQYTDPEDQNKIAELFNTKLKMEPSPEDNDKALTDIVRRVKEDSIEQQMNSTSDILKWQELIKEKGRLSKLHISL
ncbi:MULTISPECIES: DNA primase [Anaerostipes]|uniref:DNA primase n=1 Tax=Anaerostipes TaxID=207244 RepID=UPI0009525687|nr:MULTISPECIES: DNA primase [unclassified Anaerostipes]MCI5622403.1 DNA primase [Anaerostipes sp.]MDY2727092.1 DNA primase [Anaerostipes faecalis]OLR58226.1 DNA primase [Anaerostipes sp. 494a]